jgi:hypothetical protein
VVRKHVGFWNGVVMKDGRRALPTVAQARMQGSANGCDLLELSSTKLSGTRQQDVDYREKIPRFRVHDPRRAERGKPSGQNCLSLSIGT